MRLVGSVLVTFRENCDFHRILCFTMNFHGFLPSRRVRERFGVSFFDLFLLFLFERPFDRFFDHFASLGGSIWAPLGTPGAPLGPLRAPNGCSWGVLGAVWESLGPFRGRLREPGVTFGVNTGQKCPQIGAIMAEIDRPDLNKLPSKKN